MRQKLAPARLLLLVPRLRGRAGFHIPPSSQTRTLHVWQADDWGRLGFLVGPNSGWTWWCENLSSVLPGADNLCCGVWLLQCVCMAVEQRGLSLWMLDRCSWRVVSPPHSCSRENGLLPRQEVKSFTGHSPSWSSRHLAGFSEPWLTTVFLLWAVLLLNLGGKCFYEREGNLSCALLILLSLGAFQSHSKPLQLNKWKHQIAQCVVWQTSQSKVTFRETPAFSKEKRLLNSNVSGKELPFFEMLTWVWLVRQQCQFISLLVHPMAPVLAIVHGYLWEGPQWWGNWENKLRSWLCLHLPMMNAAIHPSVSIACGDLDVRWGSSGMGFHCALVPWYEDWQPFLDLLVVWASWLSLPRTKVFWFRKRESKKA